MKNKNTEEYQKAQEVLEETARNIIDRQMLTEIL